VSASLPGGPGRDPDEREARSQPTTTAAPQPEPGFEPPPTLAGRIARWSLRARILRSRVEAARTRHGTVDLCFDVVERDSTIGGGMLGGALAYRLFVVLLPLSLFLVSGIGIYADIANQSTSEVVSRAGLPGLIAGEIAAASSNSARWTIFVVTLPVLVYATGMLYRAVAIVHAIAWHGSGRAVRVSPQTFGIFCGVVLVQLAGAVILGWIREADQGGGVAALLLYGLLLAAAWLVLSLRLPRRDVEWTALVPGAALLGLGMLLINAFNVYITTRMIAGRIDTYGALGVAAALLFSLYLVGRVIVGSAVLNATVDERRTRASRGRSA
jgi:membrane protein